MRRRRPSNWDGVSFELFWYLWYFYLLIPQGYDDWIWLEEELLACLWDSESLLWLEFPARLFFLSCFWELRWSVSSMCCTIFPKFHRKNNNIFYLIWNSAPSSIVCVLPIPTLPNFQSKTFSLGGRNARKVTRRKKEMRRRRTWNEHGVGLSHCEGPL